MKSRWFEICPAAPETATLIVGFHVDGRLLGSFEMSYARQNTPTHSLSVASAAAARARTPLLFCRKRRKHNRLIPITRA